MEQRNRSASASVTLEAIHHQYGETVAVDAVSLQINPGELIALLGPSGCGKTTLLRIIAGLATQTGGHIAIGGERVDQLAPNARGAGIVFQNYALFPHMTVAANVAYGLRAQGLAKAQSGAIANDMLALVQMEKYAHRFPRELSGGQQQRVALARTLAVQPRVLLLDEPFAALDKNLRLDMQIEIRRIQQELGITTILVTHDQDEAMSMADRIAVMRAGKVEQFDRPEVIYDDPASLFVATFIGSANLLQGTLSTQSASTSAVDCPGCGALTFQHKPSATTATAAATQIVVVRPEGLTLCPPTPTGLHGTVRMVMPLGPILVYDIELADRTTVKVNAPRAGAAARFDVGDAIGLAMNPGASAAIFAA